HFSHGRVTNYWGGSSSATTHLMELMHYGGLLRVVRREAGIRIYALHERGDALDAPKLGRRRGPRGVDIARRHAQIEALVDVAVSTYAPLSAATLSYVVRRLRYAAPQWHGELGQALQRARHRLAHAQVDGIEWYWPAGERPSRPSQQEDHEDTV